MIFFYFQASDASFCDLTNRTGMSHLKVSLENTVDLS